ncbi:MAG: hypothetical protein Q7K29_03650 [Thermoleophilia bacterium]|nr:hypothetical protein [Thermoleophilia bacterium]
MKKPEMQKNGKVTLAGYCPICGQKVRWTPTARLWPTRKSGQSALPGHSGVCSSCHQVIMFTVVSDSSED